MTELHVPNMNCGHCVATITRALHDLAPEARIDIRLAEKRVRVEGDLSAAEAMACLKEAGYAASLV